MWNTFESVRDRLNLYDNPHFEPGSGISDHDEIIAGVENILKATEGIPTQLVKTMGIEFILDKAAIEVNPLDWFGINYCGWLTPPGCRLKRPDGGWVCNKPLVPMNIKWQNDIPKTPEFEAAADGIYPTGAGSFYADYDHSVPDWDSVIGLGIPGMLKRAENKYRERLENNDCSEAQKLYYESVIRTYKAMLRFLGRVIEIAKKHISDDAKMPLMVECLEQLSVGAPETLYEYLMLTYLYHLLQQTIDNVQVRTLGNLDADGFPFYKRDLASGRLTRENTEELFRFFFEKYANQAHTHAQPIYFGGFDENGDTLINELSYIMLDAFDKNCIVSPKLFIKVMPNTPDSFLKKALEMIRHGNNCMVFINEEIGMKISRKLGRTEEETRRLVGTGCNNFASRGKETTPEHMYVNLAKGIELAMNDGVDPLTGIKLGVETGDVADFATFEDFLAAYKRQTDSLIDRAFVISDYYDSHLLDFNPTPMYSGSMPDSVESGRDAYYNGMKYNNTVMFLSCIGTVADCLMMVKKHVYDNKTVTMTELREALAHDWEGHEELRKLMLDDPDKYGNNRDEVDFLAADTLHYFCDRVMARKNLRGGHFVVNTESITLSHTWADKCGATPDGRRKGDLLSKNISASLGKDKRGITAHIMSATKIDATRAPYGLPFDYLLHSSAVKGDDGLDAYLGLLRTFMKRGGYSFQGSVQNAETLKDAQVNPENYKNLQVRISGWSWYFTKMAKNYQDEFIRRAELEEARG